MARPGTYGAPIRTQKYQILRGKWHFVLPALALGLLILFGLLGLHAVGWRRPVAPGSVIDAHASFESNCQECHQVRHAVPNVRCQRCHDPSGAGRLTNATHVLFGSGDAQKAARAPDLQCASCHIEHRGRKAHLDAVDPVQCYTCHFRGFRKHPEFALFRKASMEVPGLLFTHDRHVIEARKAGSPSVLATCATCHAAERANRDFTALSFDAHCASCHGKEGQLEGVVDPVSEQDVWSPARMTAAGFPGNLGRGEDFELGRGKIAKIAVQHRDPWVMNNVSRLRRRIDPQGWSAERSALVARLGQLERREALAAPLASLDVPGLQARAAVLKAELGGLERRLKAQAAAVPPGAGTRRLEEIVAALAASEDASAGKEAQGVRDEGAPLAQAPPGGLSRQDFEGRRAELLSLLDAVAASDKGLEPRVAELRRRLLALVPGEATADTLSRLRDRRKAELDRVLDEIGLRRAGVLPPGESLLQDEQEAIRRAITDVRGRLAAFDRINAAPETSGNTDESVVRETLDAVAAPCVKCHVVDKGRLAPVVAARRVMTRANFVHEPHVLAVQGDCLRCHPTIPASKLSKDINFKGLASCQECHGSGAVGSECLTCHRYHPPAVP